MIKIVADQDPDPETKAERIGGKGIPARISLGKLGLVKKEEEVAFLENSLLPHLRSMLDSAERRLKWLRGR